MTPEATVCAAKPPVGVSWMIRRPSVRMMRKPPAYVPALIAAGRGEHDPERHLEGVDLTGGDQGQGDDAHRLLGVLHAVPSAIVAELTICAYRKPRLALLTWAFRNAPQQAA